MGPKAGGCGRKPFNPGRMRATGEQNRGRVAAEEHGGGRENRAEPLYLPVNGDKWIIVHVYSAYVDSYSHYCAVRIGTSRDGFASTCGSARCAVVTVVRRAAM